MDRKLKYPKPSLLLAAVLILVGAILFVFSPVFFGDRTKSDVAKHVFGSEENLKVFATSSAMVARRLAPIQHGGDSLGSYEMGVKVPIPEATRGRIQKLLIQKSSYEWEMAKACIPDYGVLLTSRADDGKEIHVAICFECLILSAFENNEIVGTEDFDPITKQLSSLIKPLFPDDPEIQALP